MTDLESPLLETGEADAPAPAADGDAAAGRRVLVRLLAAVMLLVLAGGVAAVVGHQRSTQENPAIAGGHDATLVGPPSGADVTQYIAQRRRALSEAAGDQVAVVSFTVYAKASDARARLSNLDVRALMVCAPGGQPSAIAGNLDGWSAAQRASARQDLAGDRQILPTVTDPAYKAFYTNELKRLAVLEQADANASVVFGAVVQGPATALVTLSRANDIRLVDVLGTTLPDLLQVRGLRPEESRATGQPDSRPAA